MEKNRERSGKVWTVVSRLLAALALAVLFSYPGAAAIKRFKDDTGTLHITNEGSESKPQASTAFPPGGPSKARGRGGPPAPPPPAPETPSGPEEDLEDIVEEVEEPPESPAPPRRGR